MARWLKHWIISFHKKQVERSTPQISPNVTISDEISLWDGFQVISKTNIGVNFAIYPRNYLTETMPALYNLITYRHTDLTRVFTYYNYNFCSSNFHVNYFAYTTDKESMKILVLQYSQAQFIIFNLYQMSSYFGDISEKSNAWLKSYDAKSVIFRHFGHFGAFWSLLSR